MRDAMTGILALLFAGLAAAAAHADEGREPQRKTFEAQITITVKLNYLVYLPKGYDTADKDWPLILFLHGAGGSGDDLAKVRREGLARVAERKDDVPFIVVAPQSPGRGWNPEALDALLDEVVAEYRVDEDRIYLTGLSMGGFGTWALAAVHPERFAAIAPICGGGDPKQAERLKGLPTWVFHGAKDPTVPLARSEEMVKAVKEAGGDVQFTVYPEAGHDAWTETYNNPELYEWFLRHRRHPSGSR
jgi:predicted peptidase